jgi:hypothetical protein
MSIEDDDLGELIENAEAAASTEWEQNFMADMRERYDRWGHRLTLSVKQMDVLKRLARKASDPRG